MLVTLSDTIGGQIGTDGDVDFFAIDLTAGTQFDFNLDIAGSDLYNPTIWLVDPDEVTTLVAHDWESQEYRIRYTIPTSGRYFVRVANYRPGTGRYVLRLGRYVPPSLGPADPVTSVWNTANGDVAGIAVSASGDVFVGSPGGVYRLAAGAGADSVPFALGIDAGHGLAIDHRGNVLTLGCEYPNGVVWRISVSGERTRFWSGAGTPNAITIGLDGDIWIFDADSGVVRRYDADGKRKTTTVKPNAYADHLAFSPRGDLHFTDAGGLYKVVHDVPQLVIAAPDDFSWYGDFVFDRDGYIYVVLVVPTEGGANDRILLFDSQYHLVNDPIAQVGDHFAPSRITALAFGCDPDGRMARRVLVGQSRGSLTQPFALTAGIVALNPQGIRAAGWPIGGPVIMVANVVSAALGVAGVLSLEQEQFLDLQGNHNGALDIGDLRAYLRSHQP